MKMNAPKAKAKAKGKVEWSGIVTCPYCNTEIEIAFLDDMYKFCPKCNADFVFSLELPEEISFTIGKKE